MNYEVNYDAAKVQINLGDYIITGDNVVYRIGHDREKGYFLLNVDTARVEEENEGTIPLLLNQVKPYRLLMQSKPAVFEINTLAPEVV